MAGFGDLIMSPMGPQMQETPQNDPSMYDADGNLLPPEQHNRALKSVGQGVGTAIGAWFGAPGVGGAIGKVAGADFGNLFAGKNMYTGRGDIWSNLNPLDPNGPLFGPTGPNGVMGQLGTGGMMSGGIGLASMLA